MSEVVVGDSAGTSRDGRIVFGDGAIEQLPGWIADTGAGSVLLVCGSRSFEASGAARVVPDIEQVADVVRWSDFSSNTDAADLQRGLKVLRACRADVVVGVGGGSAMDMAKLLCAFEGVGDGGEADRTDGRLAEAIRSGRPIEVRRPGLVLVPTTSGSGSEATHFAVVYLGQEKYSVAGQVLRPDVAILDPELTLSGSAYQRATSGIDAVAQAIESLWATGATATSRRFARHGLRLLIRYLEVFANEPSVESSHGMAIGSHLAGRAIDISKTTAAHALSYGITKGYGVSHGHAVALTLGHFIEEHAAATSERLQPGIDPAEHEQAIATVLRQLGARTGTEARERFGGLMERIGLSTRLSDVGLTDAAERAALATSVNVERLGNNPVYFDHDALVAILERSG